VIERVADFVRSRLQNYRPHFTIVPARKRGTPFSPEDPQVVAPLLDSNLIFLGPGSPSYAVRQLAGSLAWHMIVARHRLGAGLALASARPLPSAQVHSRSTKPTAGVDLTGRLGWYGILRQAGLIAWDNARVLA
jgi:hypothetical protein